MLVTTGAQNDRYAKLRNNEKAGLRLRNNEKPHKYITPARVANIFSIVCFVTLNDASSIGDIIIGRRYSTKKRCTGIVLQYTVYRTTITVRLFS